MKAEKYKASIETHRFYDSISMTIVGGLVTVSGATAYLLEKIPSSNYSLKIGVLFASIFILFMLLCIYKKTSFYANVARNVSSKIEKNECDSGVATILKHLKEEEFREYRPDKSVWRCNSIYSIVHALCVGLIVAMVVAIKSLH